MKLLFVMDHRFEMAADGAVYTLGGKYPYRLWQEYLQVFDEIVVVCRGGPATSPVERLSLSSGPGVRHVTLGDRRGVARLLEMGGLRAALETHVTASDAVIARLPSELGLVACEAARKVGRPYLAEVVASAWDALWGHGSLTARAYAPLLERRTARAVAEAPLARYVTEQFLQKAYPTKGRAFTASNVALPPSDPGVAARRHARIEAAAAPLILGTVGSLVSRMKGVHTALEALAARRDDLPAFEYRILGEGDPTHYRAMAERLGLGDRVRFDGVLPAGGAVAAWLDDIDLYLQPSLQEGLPRALIEALSRGCPAIASTVGGTPELLPADRLHRPNDASRLGQLIVEAAKRTPAKQRGESDRNRSVAGRYDGALLAGRRLEALTALAGRVETGAGR